MEYKDGVGAAQAELSLSTQGSGSAFQFSIRVDSVGLVHPKSFTFTIGTGAHSLQVTFNMMVYVSQFFVVILLQLICLVPDRAIRYCRSAPPPSLSFAFLDC